MTGYKPLLIALTRPEGTHDGLAAALSALLPEAELIHWPLLAFEPTPEPQQAQALMAQIAADDWSIFVSPRAVHFAHRLHDLTTLPTIHWAAVGQATAAAIQSLFSDPPYIHTPSSTQDSEGLLAALPMDDENKDDETNVDMHGRTVWLFRGHTGREKLADNLRQHGIKVVPIPVYQRLCAAVPDTVHPLPSTWVITAPESLQCLRKLADRLDTAAEWSRLLHCNLVVINARTEARARSLGFTGAIVRAEAPDDAALARACAIFKQD